MILMSFACEECGFKNSEIQSGGRLNDEGGVKIALSMDSVDDFKRDIVISEFCALNIPELELELPAEKGKITTIEGILRGTHEDLQRMIQTSSHVIL